MPQHILCVYVGMIGIFAVMDAIAMFKSMVGPTGSKNVEKCDLVFFSTMANSAASKGMCNFFSACLNNMYCCQNVNYIVLRWYPENLTRGLKKRKKNRRILPKMVGDRWLFSTTRNDGLSSRD